MTVLTFLRPLLGLSALLAVLTLFRPLLKGLYRALVLAVFPRKSLEERQAAQRMKAQRQLLAMAREVESSQPNLAAELRGFAAR